MWVIGGWGNSSSTMTKQPNKSDVQSSTDGSTWTQTTSNLGAGSFGHSAAPTSSNIWVFGWNYGSSNLSWYSPDGIWTSMSFPSGTYNRSDSNNVFFDEAIWFAGTNKVWKSK